MWLVEMLLLSPEADFLYSDNFFISCFHFWESLNFSKLPVKEEDLAPLEQMGALPFTSVGFKCHRKGRVVPVGLISSQYVDPRGDL